MRKREERKKVGMWLCGVMLGLGMTACTEGSEPGGAQIYYFSALERDTFTPDQIIDRGPNIPPEELAQLEPIFESFDANAPKLFAQPDIGSRIESIENAYSSAGRYIELLGKYREDIDRQGISKSPAATRLLWGLIRLGQEAQSRKLAEELLRARPESADAWFLYGAYWIKYAAEDDDAAKRVVLGWSNTVDIDPRYRGFEGIDASTIRREVSRLRRESGVTAQELDALQRDILKASAATPPPEDETSAAVEQAVEVVRTTQALAMQDPPGARATEPPDMGAPAQQADAGPAVVQDTIAPAEPVVEQKSAQQEILLALGKATSQSAQGEDVAASTTLRRAITQHLPEGKIERADEVLTRDVDAFSLVRQAWKLELDRAGTARLFRKIAERPVKRSMTLYKYAMFAQNELQDLALTRTLLEKLRAQDADFARRYDVDALLDKL